MLETTLTAVAAHYHDELAPAIERVWIDGIDSIRADLREWLRRTAEDSTRWRPERFELGFGLSDRSHADPASVPDAIDLEIGLDLRGSIDLVERGADNSLRVTDHKTGRVRANRDVIIGGGKTLATGALRARGRARPAASRSKPAASTTAPPRAATRNASSRSTRPRAPPLPR